jgi:hypothetical protein
MKSTNNPGICRLFAVAAVCLASSGIVQAKGYSPKSHTASAERIEFEKRLSRIEDYQKKMEHELASELSKLRAELKVAKEQQIARTTIDSAE